MNDKQASSMETDIVQPQSMEATGKSLKLEEVQMAEENYGNDDFLKDINNANSNEGEGVMTDEDAMNVEGTDDEEAAAVTGNGEGEKKKRKQSANTPVSNTVIIKGNDSSLGLLTARFANLIKVSVKLERITILNNSR